MIRIEMSPYDQKDILELLDYAKEQKIINKPILRGSQKWDDSGYWEFRVEHLKKVIEGKVHNESIYKSTLIDYMEKKRDE